MRIIIHKVKAFLFINNLIKNFFEKKLFSKGGIGETVSAELLVNAPNHLFNMKSLNVKSIPYSGQPQELLERFEIDSKAIQKAVESF